MRGGDPKCLQARGIAGEGGGGPGCRVGPPSSSSSSSSFPPPPPTGFTVCCFRLGGSCFFPFFFFFFFFPDLWDFFPKRGKIWGFLRKKKKERKKNLLKKKGGGQSPGAGEWFESPQLGFAGRGGVARTPPYSTPPPGAAAALPFPSSVEDF